MPTPSMNDLRRRLVEAAPPSARFGYQGLRAADAIAVEPCLPLDFLIACDWGLDGPEWDAKLRFFSVERGRGRRIVWTHSSLVEAYAGPLGKEMRDYLTEGEAPRLVIPYRSTEFLARLAEGTGGRVSVVANPLALKTRLDDKVAFRAEAERRRIAVPPGEVIETGALDETLLRRWGPRIVVTEQIGSSGNQTHLVETPAALKELKAGLCEKLGVDAPVIAARHLAGPAVGATAFVRAGQAWMSHPSVMLTGLPGCAMHRFDYAGSDYGVYGRLPVSAQEGIAAAAASMGGWAAAMGYRGIFGVDFVVHEGVPHALELNPRMLGTTQLLTELEEIDGTAPPTALWHLADLLGAETRPGDEDLLAPLGRTRLSGFQLLLRNTLPRRLKVGRSVPPGVYAMIQGSPRRIRDGERLAALEGPEEVLLTCAPPQAGTLVEPRGVLFKLEGRGTLFDEDAESVLPETQRMVEAFTALLGLSPDEGEARPA